MIYLDMDGVLADFDEGCRLRGVSNDHSFLHIPHEQWSNEQVELEKEVERCMRTKGFWANLPMMKDAIVLIDYVNRIGKLKVLTARPRFDDIADMVKQEKEYWLNENLGIWADNTICCLRHEKQNYAIEHLDTAYEDVWFQNILVDDLEANCEDWASAGGIAILHTSAQESIKELKKYV